MVEYAVIDQGAVSGKRLPSLHFEVITEAAPFRKLYAEIHSHQLPSPLPPEVDFDRLFVLFISMGEKPTAGYRVEIDRMKQSDGVLNVTLRLHEPPPGGFNATVMTNPFVLAKVKREKGLKKVAFFDGRGRLLESISLPEE